MSQKLNLAIATFPYGGNGGLKSEHPDSGRYRDRTIYQLAEQDSRIGEVFDLEIADTPLHMCRNATVQSARDHGADVLLMIDSDNYPDYDLLVDENPEAKPFFETSFDFLYKKWIVGEHVCVFAPYCGGSDDEVVFCCQWRKKSNRPIEHDLSLELVSREEAVLWRGIAPAAAGPTGVILFAMPMFKLIEPTPVRGERIDELIGLRMSGKINDTEFLSAVRPTSWFEYEYADIRHHKKETTEDIFTTRDLSMAGWQKHGRDTVFCNWDAWAGHMKPYWVGKPKLITPETVSNKFSDVAKRRVSDKRHIHLHQFESLTDQEKMESLTNMAGVRFPGGPDPQPPPKPVHLPPKQGTEEGDTSFEERVAEEVAKKLAEIHQPPTQDDDIGAIDTLGKWSDEMLNPQSGQDKPKEIFEDKEVVVKKIEKRIEADVSDQPVINETVISAIRGVAYKKSEVGTVQAAVIGTHTATFAVAIADTIGEGGGRVVCAGDCCEGEGEHATTRNEWLQVVTPRRAGKTVFAIPGDSKEVSDVSEEDYDMIVITECGSSLEFSVLLNGWMSRLKESGILLGTNYDPEKYPATCSVLDSMFGSSIVTDGTIWAVNPSLQAQ